jgi:excisionase family DNA binding protein
MRYKFAAELFWTKKLGQKSSGKESRYGRVFRNRIQAAQKTMKNQNSIDRLSFSVLETAKTLGVSSRTVHNLVKQGDIPHFRVGQRVLIPADALREFIAQRTKSEKS